MKKLVSLIGLGVLLTLTGCKTIESESTAKWIGCTTYEAYAKVAEKASPEFKADVEALWMEIDAVEDVMDITNVYARVADKIDVILTSKEITEKQKTALRALRKVFDTMVTYALGQNSAKKDKAIIWLKAWREGIRMMKQLNSGIVVELPLPVFED